MTKFSASCYPSNKALAALLAVLGIADKITGSVSGVIDMSMLLVQAFLAEIQRSAC